MPDAMIVPRTLMNTAKARSTMVTAARMLLESILSAASTRIAGARTKLRRTASESGIKISRTKIEDGDGGYDQHMVVLSTMVASAMKSAGNAGVDALRGRASLRSSRICIAPSRPCRAVHGPLEHELDRLPLAIIHSLSECSAKAAVPRSADAFSMLLSIPRCYSLDGCYAHDERNGFPLGHSDRGTDKLET